MSSPAADLLDLLLAACVVGTAVLALVQPRRAAGVMTFLLLGVLLAAVWARLGAPDVALAEAAIASGVTGALLVAALSETPEPPVRQRPPVLVSGLLLGLGTLLVAVPITLALVSAARRPLERPLGPLASETVQDAAVSHPVTAVLLEFRAYDTLLEVAVLVVAVVGALSLHRSGTLQRVPEHPERRPALTALVRVTAPVVLLLCGWLLVAGSTRPGGAFQAGAMLTGLLLLLHLSGQRVRVPTGRWLLPSLLAGLLSFVALGASTVVGTDRWLAVDGPGASTIILLLEAVLAVGIGVALAVLVLAGRRDRDREGVR